MASPQLAHLVLNTSSYEATKQWYLEVLEATVGIETTDPTACFLRTGGTHHQIGIFQVADTDGSPSNPVPGSSDGTTARVNHVAFEYPTLGELLETYERLAESLIVPKVCLNHGPTVSMYYEDPGENTVELYYADYTEEQITEFYAGGDRCVLSAIPFDPAELLKELRGGMSVAELIAWVPCGA